MVQLNEEEAAVVYQAAKRKGQELEPGRLDFSEDELAALGVVREYFTVAEMQEMGFKSDGVITSFDQAAQDAQTKLSVGAPFADGIKKWQIPIDMPGFKSMITTFPPDSTVLPHVHPEIEGATGGSLRTVTQGSILFEGKEYFPGDWFFVPNGTSYSFTTNPVTVSSESYLYIVVHKRTGVPEPRFSAPHEV